MGVVRGFFTIKEWDRDKRLFAHVMVACFFLGHVHRMDNRQDML